MSSFFCTDNLSSMAININAEHAYTSRKFLKKPIIQISTDYHAALFLTYAQTKSLPNRRRLYRNHFTMYLNRVDFEILICRSETTQEYVDNDAILLYQRISLSKDESMRFTSNDIAEWAISFDKDIGYSSSEPTDFHKFELLCSGEWWYFDRGIILNGITRYVQYEDNNDATAMIMTDMSTTTTTSTMQATENTEASASPKDLAIDAVVKTCNALPIMANLCKNLFIYYELYPELKIERAVERTPSQSTNAVFAGRLPPSLTNTQTIDQNTTTTTTTTTTQPQGDIVRIVSRDHLGFLQTLLQQTQPTPDEHTINAQPMESASNLRFTSIDPKITTIANDLVAETMSRANDNKKTPNITTYHNVVPARFWFLERLREFRVNCIDYFTTIGTWHTKI